MSRHDARFVAMILWMKMKMMNENMMDKMKMKMNGNMNEKTMETWNGKMKNEDEWEKYWNNDWWYGGNGWWMENMMVKNDGTWNGYGGWYMMGEKWSNEPSIMPTHYLYILYIYQQIE